MADKTYNMQCTLSDGRKINAGNFTVPQGEQGKPGFMSELAYMSVDVGETYVFINVDNPPSVGYKFYGLAADENFDANFPNIYYCLFEVTVSQPTVRRFTAKITDYNLIKGSGAPVYGKSSISLSTQPNTTDNVVVNRTIFEHNDNLRVGVNVPVIAKYDNGNTHYKYYCNYQVLGVTASQITGKFTTIETIDVDNGLVEEKYQHNIILSNTLNNQIACSLSLLTNYSTKINTYDSFINVVKTLGGVNPLPCNGIFKGIDGYLYMATNIISVSPSVYINGRKLTDNSPYQLQLTNTVVNSVLDVVL